VTAGARTLQRRSRPGTGGRPSGVLLAAQPARRALLVGEDHGEAIKVEPMHLGVPSGRGESSSWIDPFLAANRQELERLALVPEVRPGGSSASLYLTPGARIGAVALRSPATRRAVAGLVVKSRFGWASTGRVLAAVGFRVEPSVGGGTLVPGSAREIPPWILAGPVLSRLSELLANLRRDFALVSVHRTRPRGRVDWSEYGRLALPRGAWQRFLCTFPDLVADPELLAAARWTLSRVIADLERGDASLVGRSLLERAHWLATRVGPGPARRPDAHLVPPSAVLPPWLTAAVEGMCWVADERGLGGSRTLDGLPWSLEVDRLWEAWVETLIGDVAPRLGARLEVGRRGETSRPLDWTGTARSLSRLVPDLVLRFPGRAVCIDAKYKRHYESLRERRWERLEETMKEAHRADVHQALAYAAVAPEAAVDTALVYPLRGQRECAAASVSMAAVGSGSRRLRLLLVGIPFGFRGPSERDATLALLERSLRAA